MQMILEPYTQVLLGAEPSELGQDDLEELADDEDEYFRLGDVDEQFRDYAALQLKGDHSNRRGLPLWCPGCQGDGGSIATMCSA